MKKLILFTIIMVFYLLYTASLAYPSSTYEDPFTLYRDTYFIAGDKDGQVKFQLSTMVNLLYPFKSGAYIGYTQKSLWYLYEPSSPFIETNYQPEAFYRYESNDNLFNIRLPFIDYIQISPISHCSNGRDGEESRSTNKYYLEAQASYGNNYKIGINLQLFAYYGASLDNNPDIEKYTGHCTADIFFKLMSRTVDYLDKEEVHIRIGGTSLERSWIETTFQVRILSSRVQPKFYFQLYHGYGEFLIDYNKRETAFRAGLGF